MTVILLYSDDWCIVLSRFRSSLTYLISINGEQVVARAVANADIADDVQ